VVDMRRMNNKRATGDAKRLVSSLVHAAAPWSKGHMLHVFYEKKCVLSMVVSLSDVQTTVDTGVYKRALEPTQMAKCLDVDYDETEESSMGEAVPPTTTTTTTGSVSQAACGGGAASAATQNGSNTTKTSKNKKPKTAVSSSSTPSSPPQ